MCLHTYATHRTLHTHVRLVPMYILILIYQRERERERENARSLLFIDTRAIHHRGDNEQWPLSRPSPLAIGRRRLRTTSSVARAVVSMLTNRIPRRRRCRPRRLRFLFVCRTFEVY